MDDNQEQASRSSLTALAIGYLGTGLLLAAFVVAITRVWPNLAISSRLSVAGVSAVVLLGVAWRIEGRRGSVLDRLGILLLFLSVGPVALLAAVVVRDVMGGSVKATTTFVGLAWSLYAAGLYVWRRALLIAIALIGGLLVTVFGGVLWLGLPPAQWVGLILWAAGLSLLLLGEFGHRLDRRTAFVFGALSALIGPAVTLLPPWATVLGFATSLALVAASVGARSTVLLGFGALGLLTYTPLMAFAYLAGAGALALALLIAGAVLLALAIIYGRRGGLRGSAGAKAEARWGVRRRSRT